MQLITLIIKLQFYKMKTRITDIFNIKYPIIQGGMIWASGWELASAVSNAGGLGLLETTSENVKQILKILLA